MKIPTFPASRLLLVFALLITSCSNTNNSTTGTAGSSASTGSSSGIPIGVALALTSNVALLGSRRRSWRENC